LLAGGSFDFLSWRVLRLKEILETHPLGVPVPVVPEGVDLLHILKPVTHFAVIIAGEKNLSRPLSI
jgi:hypothetical protein